MSISPPATSESAFPTRLLGSCRPRRQTCVSALGRSFALALAAAIVLTLTAGTGTASAAQRIIGPTSGPLTNIFLNDNLACQVAHQADTPFQFYGSSNPGSCGTFIHTGGTRYGPPVISTTAYTLVSQSLVTGLGTSGSPYAVTTVVNVGTTGLQISQTDTYVVGKDFYRTDITVSNSTATTKTAALYHAADCYVAGADKGYGYHHTTLGTYCAKNANNSPSGRIGGFVPLSPGSHFIEAFYSTTWSAINGNQFPDTCSCATFVDNGVGISWSLSVPPTGSVTRSLATAFALPPDTLTLAPSTDTNTAGDQHCVTATLNDGFGIATAGATIRFSVGGANSSSGSLNTNASGQAQFCYTGTNVGNDTITAYADKNVNGVDDGAGEADATASKTYTAANPATLSLSPASATNTVGQQHCVTSTVRDPYGNATPGISVQFTVTGANSGAGSGTTDSNGEATFCYTGTTSGNDSITAFADTNGNTIQDVGEPADTASKTYANPPPTTPPVEYHGSLVPNFRETISDSQCVQRGGTAEVHGNPIALPSCELPGFVPGTQAHMGNQASGIVDLVTIPGGPGGPDDADIAIEASVTDVRVGGPTGPPYDPDPAPNAQDMSLLFNVRLSDSFNSNAGATPLNCEFSESCPATVSDFPVSAPASCVPSGPGSVCNVKATADGLIPNFIKEAKDTTVQVYRPRLQDAGVDGNPATQGNNRDAFVPGIYVRDVPAAPTPPFDVPADADSIDTALVPNYRETISDTQCTNRGGKPGTHGNPPDFIPPSTSLDPSCSPPNYLPGTGARIGISPAGHPSVASGQLTVVPGDGDTGNGDTADVSIQVHATNVLDANGNEYTGIGALVERLRISDELNCTLPVAECPSFDRSATVIDFDFEAPFSCVGTANPNVGATCDLNTTADAVVPGMIKEEKNMVLQVFNLRLMEDAGGRDFAMQGLFVP